MNHPLENARPERDDNPLPAITEQIERSDRCVVVLDDDPTGTQTVYDTPVLTTWDLPTLTDQLRRDDRMFYVLTNSRALTQPQAIDLARQIGANLLAASQRVGRPLTVISRSDSTLRGHYPAEVDAVATALGHGDATRIIMPFFLQGGRLTIDDVHYVVENDRWVPAAQTPFAKDATFGFSQSNLIDWVSEKHQGNLDRNNIHSVSLDDLRGDDLDAVSDRLLGLAPGSTVIVNAVALSDAQAFALAARKAEQRGADLIYRTAASFVQAYAGLAPRPLLAAPEMVASEHRAGLIVVGSYVPKTTAQLQHLLATDDPPQAVQLDVAKLLADDRGEHLRDTADQVNALLSAGRDVVLHTSRGLVTGDDGESSLRIGTSVSQGIVDVVRNVTVPLRFLIAKGGITSSDVATRALETKRARVLGQILPGIPVWSLGENSRAAKLPYIVFPGNVGDDDALAVAYNKLRHQ
ncbi:hypothetical protein NHH03_09510 [Stieleria sp. TO1_6]|uniref:four-carbon acid sugar kinase family protein n=1 Tax=Stieleria tagensis TaxID=2956795 RepID=UPI00209A6B60|nr:four-carbon acid sugar kinase family protein [Stieleria tagensis]MCO8121972.1 hypothetical protein [Stieleria tagensis]